MNQKAALTQPCILLVVLIIIIIPFTIHSNTDYTCDTQIYIVLHMHISTVNNLFASLLERRQFLIHKARTVTSLCYSIVVTQIISLVYTGHSQECVNGLMSAERVWQLGRVAGSLESDHESQQRIIPDITFAVEQ